LSKQLPVGGTVWEALGGVALLEEAWPLLEEAWPCWRRRGLVGGGVALLEEAWPCWRRRGLVGGGVSLS